DALKKMGYRAFGFGADDLRLSAAELFAIVVPVGDQPSPFVCANAGLYGFDDKTLPRFSVIDVGGKKIGITIVVGDGNLRKVNNDGVESKPAETAIAEVLPQLQAAKCDMLVLL